MELWIGAGLALLGIAVGLGQWVLPVDKIASWVRVTLIVFACCAGLVGLGLIVYALSPHNSEQLSAKPHVAMIPSIGMLNGKPTVSVKFHNRGKVDVDNVTFKITLTINGDDLPESINNASILRHDTNRPIFVMLTQQTYDAIIAGKNALRVTSSVVYSFNGASFTESCLTRFDAPSIFFDHIDC